MADIAQDRERVVRAEARDTGAYAVDTVAVGGDPADADEGLDARVVMAVSNGDPPAWMLWGVDDET